MACRRGCTSRRRALPPAAAVPLSCCCCPGDHCAAGSACLQAQNLYKRVPQLALCLLQEEIQYELDRRRPGQSRITTPRQARQGGGAGQGSRGQGLRADAGGLCMFLWLGSGAAPSRSLHLPLLLLLVLITPGSGHACPDLPLFLRIWLQTWVSTVCINSPASCPQETDTCLQSDPKEVSTRPLSFPLASGDGHVRDPERHGARRHHHAGHPHLRAGAPAGCRGVPFSRCCPACAAAEELPGGCLHHWGDVVDGRVRPHRTNSSRG